MAIGLGAGLLLGGLVSGVTSLFGASKAASGAESAAATSADAQIAAARLSAKSQREALDYLKQTEKLPQEYREAALRRLAAASGFGPPGWTGEGLVTQAQRSPLYKAIMGGREAGEESILRNAGATGGLRSGNVQEALYDYNVQLQNKALLESYNQELQGLQGLAGLPSNAPQIAQTISGIGATQGQGIAGAGQATAQGQVASGQAWQQGLGNISDIILGGLGTYYKYGGGVV